MRIMWPQVLIVINRDSTMPDSGRNQKHRETGSGGGGGGGTALVPVRSGSLLAAPRLLVVHLVVELGALGALLEEDVALDEPRQHLAHVVLEQDAVGHSEHVVQLLERLLLRLGYEAEDEE